MKSVQVDPSLLQCFFTVRRMQYDFSRYHFGLEWEKRKIVRRVRAKRILQTAPHRLSDHNHSVGRALESRSVCQ